MDSKKSIKFVLPSKKSKKGKKIKFVTKKQEKRLKEIEEKNRERELYHKIEEFKGLLTSDESITNKSIEIFNKIISGDYNDNDIVDYEALVAIIHEKNFSDKSINLSDYYPDYTDKDFNKKIYQKLEFYLNRNVRHSDLTPSKRKNYLNNYVILYEWR